jgi:hypothetical protein
MLAISLFKSTVLPKPLLTDIEKMFLSVGLYDYHWWIPALKKDKSDIFENKLSRKDKLRRDLRKIVMYSEGSTNSLICWSSQSSLPLLLHLFARFEQQNNIVYTSDTYNANILSLACYMMTRISRPVDKFQRRE